MKVSDAAFSRLLKQFGHAEFRPPQREILRSVLDGNDILAVLPTGAGKSLIYQMASQLLPGGTVVVSPLIALMHDQEESISAQGVDVGVVNSTRSAGAVEDDLERFEQGESKLLYVTPERLSTERFLERLAATSISLLVVDEAHTIWEWGHDFRPAYLQLRRAVEALSQPAMLALTATATPWVRADIIERLGMRSPDVFVYATDRPNLFLEVLRVEDEAEDQRTLRDLLAGHPTEYPDATTDQLDGAMQGAGIIYCRTTKATEETAGWLREWGIDADYYHGQRRKQDRERVQDAFMTGEIRVVCATNAFGLGIDKPDVRFVIHRDIPASLDMYYQEAGRAGRDGDFARCTLIYRPGDLGRAAFLSAPGSIDPKVLAKAVTALAGAESRSLDELEQVTGASERDVAVMVAALDRAGVIDYRAEQLRLRTNQIDAASVVHANEERRAAYERSRIEMMRGYAETADCRRVFILSYFGEEPSEQSCRHCDNDVRSAELNWVQVNGDEPVVPVPFAVGDRVFHEEWGEGLVNRLEDDSITILFDDAGYKTLDNDLVLQKDLLRPAP